MLKARLKARWFVGVRKSASDAATYSWKGYEVRLNSSSALLVGCCYIYLRVPYEPTSKGIGAGDQFCKPGTARCHLLFHDPFTGGDICIIVYLEQWSVLIGIIVNL